MGIDRVGIGYRHVPAMLQLVALSGGHVADTTGVCKILE
jgi:hypothetical protein